MMAPSSFAAPVALQLVARLRSRVIGHTWDGRSLDAGYGPLHVVRCVLHVACCLSHVCMLPPEQSVSACPHAQTHLSVWPWPMQRSSKRASVTPRARTESVTAPLLCWSRLPRHILCTAAAPHPLLQSSVGLQLERIKAAGTEKALLADVTEAHPDASYIELLRLFKVRRSVADGHT